MSYLLLFCCTSAIFCGSLELSVSCQQTSFWPLLLSLLLVSWAWLRPGFIQKTLQPLLFSLPSPDLHSTGLNPISQVGLSGFPGEESYPKNINWPQDFLGDWFLDPSSSPYNYITRTHCTITWFLLPFLCWWHTALSLILTRESNSSNMDLRLPGKHLSMDKETSPTAHPSKDWASRFICHSDSTAWFHHLAWFIKKYYLVTS